LSDQGDQAITVIEWSSDYSDRGDHCDRVIKVIRPSLDHLKKK